MSQVAWFELPNAIVVALECASQNKEDTAEDSREPDEPSGLIWRQRCAVSERAVDVEED